jgi:hypothetical protein
VKLSGGNPTSTTAFSNVLTPMNLIKGWALVSTTGGGAADVNKGFNVSGAAISGTYVRVLLETDLADASVGCVAMNASGGQDQFYSAVTNAAGYCEITAWDLSAAAEVNFSNTARTFTVLILGAQ